MGDFELRYRADVLIESLAENECTIRPCALEGKRWWNLWFYVARETDGGLEYFEVPIIARGSFTESGPGGRSWGFNPTAPGTWQVSPSINVLQTDEGRSVHPGPHPTLPSLWHKTPSVSGIPDGEPWASSGGTGGTGGGS